MAVRAKSSARWARQVVLLGALALGVAIGAPPRSRATLTYIGNEGFALEANGKTVLLDVLQTVGTAAHGDLPGVVFEQMLEKKPPFRRVPLVLASHPHADHFVPSVVARFLSRHSESALACVPLICSLMEGEPAAAQLRQQIREVPLGANRTGTLAVEGVEVTLMELPHLAFELYQVPVIAHLVRIGDVTVLHVGDAELPAARLAQLGLRDAKIDVAILPYWIFTQPGGRALVDQHIGARRIVSMRLPQGGLPAATENVLRTFPEAVILTHPMDSIEL